MDTFAKRAKERRIALGLNQAEVAKRSGLKQPDVSKIELERIKKTVEILSLAKALQCNPDWLESGVGPMEIQNTITAPSAFITSTGGPSVIVSLEQALATLAAHLAQADTNTRTAAGALLTALAAQPDHPSVMASLNTLLTQQPFIQQQQKAA